MAVNVRTEMRIPTRSAPPPPVARTNFNGISTNSWSSSSNDLFEISLMSQKNDNSLTTSQFKQKKKPPPRPPPPKFNSATSNLPKDFKSKRPARPSELLTNLFGRKNNKHEQISSFSNPLAIANTSSGSSSQLTTGSLSNGGAVSLIDLSPPGSPTFTTRSSSDGVSVDSFGSDGNSNPLAFTSSSGSTSQTEGAFEDDFDFFGLSASQQQAQQPKNNPWTLLDQDPFEPIQSNNSVKHIGDASFFAFNDATPTEPVPANKSSAAVKQMPTIIRAKPPKPPAPKILTNITSSTTASETRLYNSCLSISSFANSKLDNLTEQRESSWPTSVFDEDQSLPMPKIPPPALPSQYTSNATRDESLQNEKTPHGIALYDFPAAQPDDLSLKEGDVVTLLRSVNDEWMEGRIGCRQGMFPANYITIKVPLPGNPSNMVQALYTFQGETWEDLSFREGDKIEVLSRISDDWLYGECNNSKGQFPANYVDRIPENLPTHS